MASGLLASEGCMSVKNQDLAGKALRMLNDLLAQTSRLQIHCARRLQLQVSKMLAVTKEHFPDVATSSDRSRNENTLKPPLKILPRRNVQSLDAARTPGTGSPTS